MQISTYSAEGAAEDRKACCLHDASNYWLDGLSARSRDKVVAGEQHRQYHSCLLQHKNRKKKLTAEVRTHTHTCRVRTGEGEGKGERARGREGESNEGEGERGRGGEEREYGERRMDV